ncbi:ligase-associated DNA damage response endonuclease PdeM [Pseudomonas vlassakiae]|jgi:DNA ligase-associated metallophosphoesterase|uniref:ligase-associated DNA damage response endonuclease PdeM n=1 Tax=Pseudomonas TaxID=286 RepID=UPI0006D406C4|nr:MULTISPECIES: ligase-associated DNA damage response endonuclease PdeM [Pseudomonas]AXQ49423.1 ligase-associated DNA damage response endonuclease PdeM [Stenotrophomonas rhizophila]MBS3186633.1 ligase-associated DNA damage response endonuclease PdeM [Pseudomonas sp. PCH44]MCU0123891.1 ligase-associated DNA damage response endonuclease PdeM [Pseudomonas vlassakiae]PIK77072.1 DEAD/DEAH box helicase [Pseudomonas sp. 382]HCV39095.1 ligase-associated DNA damage response endonuclease PdeM [Pseudomo
MNTYLPVEHCGETLWLLPDKAIYWPARRTLLVADVHIGKAASYRALHQPVPRGTTSATLARLDRLLHSYACEQLIILGDFLHARAALAPGTQASLQAWRTRHSAVKVVLVRGNHDRHAGDPPVQLGIEVVDEPLLLAPFALQHEPTPHPSHPVLAGHVHPVYVLRGRARQRLRLPCFLIDAQVSLLPAFGEFTGGWLVEPGSDTRVFLAGGDQVWALAT